jgi:hypothetical protein
MTARRVSAFDGARNKGALARIEGKPISANPYGDARTWHGGVTFARAFWRAWRVGWQTAEDASQISLDVHTQARLS